LALAIDKTREDEQDRISVIIDEAHKEIEDETDFDADKVKILAKFVARKNESQRTNHH
jgi:hypothetical protein